MNLRLRPTQPADLDYVIQAERADDNRPYVNQWTRQQHEEAFFEPDLAHLIIEDRLELQPLGYLILAGLSSPNRSIEFRRMVVTLKGQGIGRRALQLVKKMAFEDLKAHRLWLDVRDHNQRARSLYASEGFFEEGILRECVWVDDHYESLALMAILSHEYFGIDNVP